MGGFGSGRRWGDGGKRCTDDMCSIDVRRLQRDGLLKSGATLQSDWTRRGETVASIGMAVMADRVRFIYRARNNGGPWEEVSCDAMLDRTPMHFGGVQTWWRCPCCHRRVALLYVGRRMACRHCWNLAHRCERESDVDRATRRAERIRERLGWEPGILNDLCRKKPKGMHWRTFERLRTEHDAHAGRALAMMERWLRHL